MFFICFRLHDDFSSLILSGNKTERQCNVEVLEKLQDSSFLELLAYLISNEVVTRSFLRNHTWANFPFQLLKTNVIQLILNSFSALNHDDLVSALFLRDVRSLFVGSVLFSVLFYSRLRYWWVVPVNYSTSMFSPISAVSSNTFPAHNCYRLVLSVLFWSFFQLISQTVKYSFYHYWIWWVTTVFPFHFSFSRRVIPCRSAVQSL